MFDNWQQCGDARLEHLYECPDAKVTRLDQALGGAVVECPHDVSVMVDLSE